MWTCCFLRRSARWNFSPSSLTSPLYCEHVIRNLGSETYSDLWKRTTSFWMCPNGHPCHTISRTVWSSWRRPSRYRDRRAVATPNHRVCVRSSAIRSDIVIKPGTNSKKRHRFMCVHMWEDERQEKEAEGDRRERERCWENHKQLQQPCRFITPWCLSPLYPSDYHPPNPSTVYGAPRAEMLEK